MKRQLAYACILLTATAAAQTFQYGPTTGDAARGKRYYYDHGCYACHGYQGIGRRNLANDASGILINEQVFLTYLRARADLNPKDPSQAMPHYSEDSLSDAHAKDIYAYVRTFRDDPPEVTDIPALKAILDDASH